MVFIKMPVGEVRPTLYREVILEVRRTIFLHITTVQGRKSHPSILTWLKHFFGTVVGWLTCRVGSYDSRDTENARLGNVLRASSSADASPGPPGPPEDGQGRDGRIHNVSSRYNFWPSEKWHHFACTSVVIIFFVHLHGVLNC